MRLPLQLWLAPDRPAVVDVALAAAGAEFEALDAGDFELYCFTFAAAEDWRFVELFAVADDGEHG